MSKASSSSIGGGASPVEPCVGRYNVQERARRPSNASASRAAPRYRHHEFAHKHQIREVTWSLVRARIDHSSHNFSTATGTSGSLGDPSGKHIINPKAVHASSAAPAGPPSDRPRPVDDLST
jgi:hypothetical protein